ncbi:hypothetical protein M409DRAFT_26342 [Zasmidium cellare ATCC 36951]|uniref:Trichothecene 3-O-acetyltransferase-like N-terminal domain-containing protein n=1 Tax=Zasmidium cellare ATCC 36951 TaxID=1080233 RepID=A0A6A6C838_ZASCE|nr:uncharacterized protein M409DRAFT_26342 [Zasmidium cellare ATCC 36951]KAF2163304.1 hypothetical protein M409DRAFT_26342 [Zasmidium cellare ATCC 36951]
MDKTIYIPGAEPKVDLQYSDVWLPGLYSRRVLCFELPEGSSHEKAIDVVERGLKALVLGTPELAADAVVLQNAAPHDPKQPWRAMVKGKGVELVIKDMRKTTQSYKELEKAGFPLSFFKDSAFMPVNAAVMPEPQSESVYQLSMIEGGVLLSVCLYHRLTDGNGMNSITRALGDECKKAFSITGDLPPRKLDTDRSTMASLNGGKTDLKDHPAHSIVDQIFNPNTKHDEAPPEANGEAPKPPPRFVPAYFRLTNDKAQALKDYCSRDMPVSTHDAISALLWRTLIKTRTATGELDPSTLSTFTVPHNARRHIGLPKDWIGNCVYFIQAQASPSAEILKDDSAPALAAKIRSALNTVNREYMTGISTIRRKDPYSLHWWAITEANSPEILAITSFYHSELLGYDFGPALGNVKHFTSTDIGAFGAAFQRAHFVGPRFMDGRGCDVHVGLLEEEVEGFYKDETWSKYFTLLETGEKGK